MSHIKRFRNDTNGIDSSLNNENERYNKDKLNQQEIK